MRILIADDDEIYRGLLCSTLSRWGYQAVAVSDGEQALACLSADGAPSLAVLDWMMPGLSGPEVCKRLRAAPGPRYTYLLLLTARAKMEEVVEGLEAGADDYLTKPFQASELRARLRTAVRILELQEKLLDSRRELEELATHDPLTQLWNRRAILERLAREWSRALREKKSLGVLLADVDRFKEVNDRHGHLAGDQVLCEVARRMTAALRPYDLLGRFGGEEFLVGLSTDAPESVCHVAERLREAVAASPFSAEGLEFPLSVSIGLAVAPADPAAAPELLIHAADGALYRAKQEGRNRVCCASSAPELHASSPALARSTGSSRS